MKRKMLSLMLSLFLMVTILGGCGNNGKAPIDNKDSTEENKASTEDTVSNNTDDLKFNDVTIKVAARYTENGDIESDYYINKVKEFNEMDNGITVEMTNITDEANYLNTLSTNFASGDVPNVFQEYGGSRCLNYIESDALLDLTPYLDADPEWRDGFYSTNWDPCIYTDYGYDGTYGVPWGAYQVLLYYNKAILEDNNIEVPESFDQLLEACQTLKDNGVSPFIVGEKDIYRFGHLHSILSLKTYGPEIAEKLANREVPYDGEEMLNIYGMIKDMVDKGYLGDRLMNAAAPEEREYFGQGECAFMYDTSRAAAVLQDTELLKSGNIGVTAFPYVKEEYKNVEMGGASSAYYITKMNATEEEIEASVVFLKYITNTDYANGLMKLYPNTYSVKTTVDSDNYLYNEILNAMSTAEVYKTDLQNYDGASHMTNTVREALQLLAIGESPETVGKQIVAAIAEYE